MSKRVFPERLEAVLTSRKMKRYALSKQSGVSQDLLSKIYSEAIYVSDEVAEKLANSLGLPFEQLKAWADYDRLGPEGVVRLWEYLPELLARPSQAPDAAIAAPPTGKRVRPIPEADLDLVLEGAEGLTAEERQVVAEAEALGLKPRSIGTPDYLKQPIEKRQKTVQLWKDRIAKARMNQETRKRG